MFPVVHQQDLHNPSFPENLRAAKPSPFPFVPISVMLASGMDRLQPYRDNTTLCSASGAWFVINLCLKCSKRKEKAFACLFISMFM